MSKLEDILGRALNDKIEAVWNTADGRVTLDKATQQIKDLIKELPSMGVGFPTPVSENNGHFGGSDFGNGYNQALKELRQQILKELDEL
jgi:hypothetical protein